MVSFSALDITIIVAFFVIVVLIGFYSSRKLSDSTEDYLLSGRKLGLLLFVLTNVATWYGGILGVGEFTYSYGLLSWFTQGLPYYIFAFIFALFFAKKIREASLFTIPDKIEETYGKTAGLLSAGLIFILVSPAPYLLMIGSIISLIFDINLFWGLIAGTLLSVIYMFKGGYRSDVMTDVFEFFVMFAGFIVIVVVSYLNFGGVEFLEINLPESHLDFTGGESSVYILVWFLIALWTFTDPGFHQRCYAAKTGNTAKWGIIISIILWGFFDFLTTSTGLYARVSLPGLDKPVLAFPLYAEALLSPGLKGLFYAGLIATVMSTLNSFLFLSATTYGRDFLYRVKGEKFSGKINSYTRWGLLVSAVISILMAWYMESVIAIWYTIGSICIPGLILPVTGAYYNKLRVPKKYAVAEIITAVLISWAWVYVRPEYNADNVLSLIEPMIVGLLAAFIIHLAGMYAVRSERVNG